MAEEAFKKHEIVPDVISSPPKQTIKVEYEGGHEVNLGAELTPRQVKDQPKVIWEPENDALYTLAMIDPDASSLKDANRIEVEHWLVINIPGNDIEKGETLSDYYGAGPPKDTGDPDTEILPMVVSIAPLSICQKPRITLLLASERRRGVRKEWM
uniref:Uncharacterized protein n=1 Tax=Acrobeloides nanus TaxID=290746 RepID=A0A914CZS8_9BILA